jgi:hypothetical protein
MAFLRCKTCGGEFDDTGADGMAYYHVCPPLSIGEMKDALAQQALPLTARQVKALQDARAADDVFGSKEGETSRADALLATFVFERPRARNENVDLAKAKSVLDDKGRRKPGVTDEDLVRAPGAGVEILG